MNLVGVKSLNERFLAARCECFNKKYDYLNQAQREAVFTVNGPLLVLAGAGSGKTTVLAERIAYIIKYGNAFMSNSVPAMISEEDIEALKSYDILEENDRELVLAAYSSDPCPPWAILSFTFTNKAANNMKIRLEKIVGEGAADIWAGTFHSICMRILRKHWAEAGLKSGFTIYDTEDSRKLITNILRDLNINEKQIAPRFAQNNISRAKDKLITAEQFENELGEDITQKMISKIYHEYQKRMYEANVLDFDDIIMRTVQLFRERKDVLDYYSHRFKYICVDEYQDTNGAQLELIILLSSFHKNLMVVGDDDQSIYKFRGARIENILNFDRILDNVKIIKLEQNYRSTQNILSAANSVISNNIGRRGKTLFTANDIGEKIYIKRCENQNDEARFIINKIVDLTIREKRKFSEFAILYRVNAQSNSLETVFAKSGIPYRIVGGLRFYERKEIKDIIAYLCIISNNGDNLRLRRIINEPKRKIGETTLKAVDIIAESNNLSMFDVMKNAEKFMAISKFAPKLHEFTSLIDALCEIAKTEPLPVLVEKTIELSGYRQMLMAAGEEEADRLENIQELISNAVEYDRNIENATLQGFLEEVALIADIDNYDTEAEAVVMMTIHSAKGLEFPVIFIPGFEEGIFPGMQSSVSVDELEEERRLAYVAITRAKERLFCLHVKERLIYGRTQYNQPSRFIKEIPDEFLDSDHIKKQQAAAEAKAAAQQYMNEDDKNLTPSAQRERSKRNMISKEFYKKADSAPIPAFKNSISSFNIGEFVSHITFGRGEVLSVTPMGGDTLYEIAFDSCGTKKLMANFAKLKKED